MHTAQKKANPSRGASTGTAAQQAGPEATSSLQLKGQALGEQQASLTPGSQDFASQQAALTPVQQKGEGGGSDGVHAAAAHGTSGSGGSLPHLGRIQAAFGHHDVSSVQAYTGGKAAEATTAMGAEAYATGNKVAFGGAASLHTAAHEAAHIVQQRSGVQLSGGVGQVGDKYEQHADAVADAVVAGRSAAPILDEMSGGGGGGAVQQSAVQNSPVQYYKQYGASGDKDAKNQVHWKSNGDALRVTEDGTVAVEQPSMYGSDKMYVLGSRVAGINTALLANKVPLKFATDGATVKGAPPTDLNKSMQTLTKVKPVQVADPTKNAKIPDDCGRAAHTVTGATASGKTLKTEYKDASGKDKNAVASHPEIMKLEIMAEHFKAQVPNAAALVVKARTELSRATSLSSTIGRKNFTKLNDLHQDVETAVAEFKTAAATGDAAKMKAAKTKYQAAKKAWDGFLKTKESTTGKTYLELFQAHAKAVKDKLAAIDAIFAPYNKLTPKQQEAFDEKVGINRHANPEVGQAYTVSSGGAPKSKKTWNYHWGGVIIKSTTGSDNVTMEGYAGSIDKIYHQVYGVPTKTDKRKGQTFHEQTRDAHQQHGDAPTTMATEKM